MPQTNRKEMADRFIASLKNDIRSAKHGSEINNQALGAAIDLLKNQHMHPELSIAQMVRGALNMTLDLENSKYGFLTVKSVDKDIFDVYLRESIRWFGDYNEQLKSHTEKNNYDHDDIAIPVIERASKGPLYMATNCAEQTLALYFEYVNQVDPSIAIPKLPLPRNADDSRVFDIFIPEINKFKDEDLVVATVEAATAVNGVSAAVAKNAPATGKSSIPENDKAPSRSHQFLDNMLKDLTARIELLKAAPAQHKNSIKAADELKTSLSSAVEAYRAGVSSSPELARTAFLTSSDAALKLAKPKLEKELGWSDYLTNLGKAIANAFRSAANAVFHSNYTLFTPEKAPGIAEVEKIEKDLTDWSKP